MRSRRLFDGAQVELGLLPLEAAGGALTLVADPGAFTLAGQDVALLVARRLAADAGAFTLAGQDVGLLVLLPSLPPDGRVLAVATEGRLVLLDALPRELAVRSAGRIIRIPAAF